MAEEKKPEVVTMSKDYHDLLLAQSKQTAELLKRIQTLEENPKGQGIETSVQKFSKNLNERMKGETNEEARKSIVVIDEPAEKNGVYLIDKCPFCIKENKGVRLAEFDAHKSSILDMTQGGKYSCRRCGKHWHPWAIFPEQHFPEYAIQGPLTYSIHVEQGNLEKVENQLKLESARKGEAVIK